MSFSINSVEREADKSEELVITEDALDILGNVLEEEGIQILEEAIEIAENEDSSAVRGKEIREAFFES
jgi:histone H3/H4